MKTGKRVGIKEIARRCGVGVSTVSRVINNRGDVSPEKRKRIAKLIRDLGYIPSASARGMRRADPFGPAPTQTIEIVGAVHGLKSLFSSELMDNVIAEAAGMGYHVITSVPSKGEAQTACDGRVFVTHSGPLPGHKVPAVTVDHFADSPLVPGVLPDYETGVYEAVKTALSKGYRHPILLTGVPRSRESGFTTMMWDGFRRALKEQELVAENHVYARRIYSKEDAYKHGKVILAKQERPDLMIAPDDAAIGIYRAAAELGIRIPTQLGVIGCDGVPIGEFMIPPLSSIRIDYRTLAREALKRLVPAMNRKPGPRPQKMVVETKFVPSGSIDR